MLNSLAVLGLSLDIAGAVVVVRAIILNPDRRIAETSGAWWECNPFLTASLIEQKVESLAGLLVLIAGFALQLLATLGLNLPWPVSLGLGLLVACALGIFYWKYKNEIVIGRAVTAVHAVVATRRPSKPPADPAILAEKLRDFLSKSKSGREIWGPPSNNPPPASNDTGQPRP
jgi:hypothetical protein